MALIFLLVGLTAVAIARAGDKTTYADHVRPWLQTRCFSCHNPDKKKGGLDVTSYAGIVAGGSSGPVTDVGNHAGSRIWQLTARKAEPFMPPDGDPLKPAELDSLVRWIDGGLLETASSTARKSDKPKLDLVITGGDKPEGPPPMPGQILREPVLVAERANAVSALAASPWAPLVAVSGARQVVLYDADTLEVAGILPFPEGSVCSLRFSRNGAFLLAAGGHGAASGDAVLFDVTTGRRVGQVGGELDTLLSADFRARPPTIAFGTPGRKLKVFDLAGTPLYVKDKHTEWVTAVGFSPDGVLLASGDRNGGVRIWEADTGNEYLNLEGHRGAITGLTWRPDGNVLASASEDGDVILWEMNGGAQVKRWTAHGGGTLDVDYSADGRLATSGRDRRVKTWSGDGKLLKDLGETPDLPTRVAWLHDKARVVAGLWTGDVVIWRQDTGERLGIVTQNPPTLGTRLAAAEQELVTLQPRARETEEALAAARAAFAATSATVAKWEKQATEMRERISELRQELATLEKQQAEVEKLAAALAPQLEAQRRDEQARLQAQQQAVEAVAAQNRRIAQLKADQFNVGVLGEETRLADLDRQRNEQRAARNAAQANQGARRQQAVQNRELSAQLEQDLPALEAAAKRQSEESQRLDAELADLRQKLLDQVAGGADVARSQAAEPTKARADQEGQLAESEQRSKAGHVALARAEAALADARTRREAAAATQPELDRAAREADEAVAAAEPLARQAEAAYAAQAAKVEALKQQHRSLLPGP